jgi:hypothetical protein
VRSFDAVIALDGCRRVGVYSQYRTYFRTCGDSDGSKGAVVTAALCPDQRGIDRAEQVEHLRRKIAAVSDKASRGHSPPPRPEELIPGSKSLLELPRGAVVTASGARSLLLNVVAATTAAGGHTAVVGLPDIGVLAAVEMGADLSRLALVPDPGTDPIEVAAVLLDGMDLVVLGLGGRSVPLSRARAVTARARTKGCTLLVFDGDWQGARMRLKARVSGYELAPGRIRGVQLSVNGRAWTYDTQSREKRAISPHSAHA